MENEKHSIANFRFSIIHEFVGGSALSHGEKRRLLKEKSTRKWDIPFTDRTRISHGTILRWIKLYEESGGQLESLYPKNRSDIGKSRAIDEETGLSLIHLRQKMPDATVPLLIRIMTKRNLFPPCKDLKTTTTYRFLHNQNLMKPQDSQIKTPKTFETELPNDISQSDAMCDPIVTVPDKERKSYLIALFRFGIISDFVYQIHMKFGDQKRLIAEKCSRNWQIPYSKRTRLTSSTIFNWIRRYKRSGNKFASLYPQGRCDVGLSRTIDEETAQNLIQLIKDLPIKSVSMLITEMKNRCLIKPGTSLRLSTVYRFLGQKGLMDYLKERKKLDYLEFESVDENKLWMRKLLQGKIKYIRLEEELSSKIPIDHIKRLYNCILTEPLMYRNRAITILCYFRGISRNLISEYLLIPRPTIIRHLNQYGSGEIERLLRKKRRANKKYQDPEYIRTFFKILHAPPSAYGFNRTNWRQNDIKKVMAQKGFKICKGHIARIIKDAGYRYRKAKTVLTSNDPEYKEKVKVITDILSNLGLKEKFFSVDEYGPFAIKLQGGKSLVSPDQIKIVPQWQKSKGSIIITAALELSSNQVTHFYSENKNSEEMIKLLEILIQKYDQEDCIYFSWDAASWHASKKFKSKVQEINSKKYKFKTKYPLVKLAPLPTCSQFLNVIESVFSGMARAIIHNSDFLSVEECKNAIDRYFEERNRHFRENPKRAGKKIWGMERVKAVFDESNNCKDPMYR